MRVVLLVAMIVSIAVPRLAFASSALLETAASVSFQTSYLAADSCSHLGESSASCRAAGTAILNPLYPDSVSLGGAANAVADFGILRSFASGLASCSGAGCYFPPVSGVASDAEAEFQDTITIHNAPVSGSLAFSWTIDGTGGVNCVQTSPEPFGCGSGQAYFTGPVESDTIVIGTGTSS